MTTPPCHRRWGSHFAQSHSPSRSGRVATAIARSAGPYRVVASTSNVRATPLRNSGDPVTPAGWVLSMVIDRPRSGWSSRSSSATPKGRTTVPAGSVRRRHRPTSARRAVRTAWARSAGESSWAMCGARLNWMVPSPSVSKLRRRVPASCGSIANTREPERSCTSPDHSAEPSSGWPPSDRGSAPGWVAVTFSLSTISSNIGVSTGASPSSLATRRRPGPTRYRPTSSVRLAPAPRPVSCINSMAALELRRLGVRM